MKTQSILLLALLTVASCVAPEGPAPTTPGQAADAERPPARGRPPAPKASGDTCGARALQSLIGRPRAEIPVPVDLSRRRVTCTTCPVTLDFNPERLNILYDRETGIVRQVKCG